MRLKNLKITKALFCIDLEDLIYKKKKKGDIELVIVTLGLILVGLSALITAYGITKRAIKGYYYFQSYELIEGITLSNYYDNLTLNLQESIDYLKIGENGIKIGSVCLLLNYKDEGFKSSGTLPKNKKIKVKTTPLKSEKVAKEDLNFILDKSLIRTALVLEKKNNFWEISKKSGKLLLKGAFNLMTFHDLIPLFATLYAMSEVNSLISKSCVIFGDELKIKVSNVTLLLKNEGSEGKTLKFKTKILENDNKVVVEKTIQLD